MNATTFAAASSPADTLGSLLAAGLATELDYMTADEQSEALDRVAFLQTCASNEIQDAAEFIALGL